MKKLTLALMPLLRRVQWQVTHNVFTNNTALFVTKSMENLMESDGNFRIGLRGEQYVQKKKEKKSFE